MQSRLAMERFEMVQYGKLMMSKLVCCWWLTFNDLHCWVHMLVAIASS